MKSLENKKLFFTYVDVIRLVPYYPNGRILYKNTESIFHFHFLRTTNELLFLMTTVFDSFYLVLRTGDCENIYNVSIVYLLNGF